MNHRRDKVIDVLQEQILTLIPASTADDHEQHTFLLPLSLCALDHLSQTDSSALLWPKASDSHHTQPRVCDRGVKNKLQTMTAKK